MIIDAVTGSSIGEWYFTTTGATGGKKINWYRGSVTMTSDTEVVFVVTDNSRANIRFYRFPINGATTSLVPTVAVKYTAPTAT